MKTLWVTLILSTVLWAGPSKQATSVTVYFDQSSMFLSAKEQEKLRSTYSGATGGYWKILGYADKSGGPLFNAYISKMRAKAVEQFLQQELHQKISGVVTGLGTRGVKAEAKYRCVDVLFVKGIN